MTPSGMPGGPFGTTPDFLATSSPSASALRALSLASRRASGAATGQTSPRCSHGGGPRPPAPVTSYSGLAGSLRPPCNADPANVGN
eukprot:CAMPEP_0115172894 /NCGR_PEP_ID=MMETSP0270-20121206/3050_1 /TAXON_ID=71861 /ORGANISM="Scrippsiella trochoidea, Strain CCMP3099" /LENGTH=85 /DNA_ID=CAMNT_0002585699 /DNA_START=270 /DNA_END=527 /DNA_ORIENTATION=+